MTDYFTWAYVAEQLAIHWWIFPLIGIGAPILEWRFRLAEERIAMRVAGVLY